MSSLCLLPSISPSCFLSPTKILQACPKFVDISPRCIGKCTSKVIVISSDSYRIHRSMNFSLCNVEVGESLCSGGFVGSPRDTPCRWAHVGWTQPSSSFSDSNRVLTAARRRWRGEHKGHCGGQPCSSDAKRKSSWRGKSAAFIFRRAYGGMVEPSLHCHAARQTGQQFCSFSPLQRKGH